MSKALERPLPPAIAYDDDVVAWANAQAARLRAIADPRVDFEHIADELESMGRSDRNEIESRMTVLLTHLLKWEHQVERRSRSWRRTILEQRDRLDWLVGESPSLKSAVESARVARFHTARIYASDETGIAIGAFPRECAWTTAQILELDFYPGPPAADDLPVE